MFRSTVKLNVFLLAVVCSLAMSQAARSQPVTPDVSEELAVVNEVLATDEIQKAFEYVDGSEEETVREWLSICNAYGPSERQSRSAGRPWNEIRRSRLLYQLFRIYGLSNVHIDDRLNVVGVRKGVGDGPTVVLNAHHDNVALWPEDQPIEAFVADGRVWAPASGDDLMGVTQILTVVRAMNAADIETSGDIWFTTFTGEELGSAGAEHFVLANYPHNIDWKKGDTVVQLHGGGGEGVTTGSSPYIHTTQLRVFVPLDWNRWRTDAVDALGPILQRINQDLRDPRSLTVAEYETGQGEVTSDLLYLNIPMIQGNVIHNGTTNQAWMWFDLRAGSEERLWKAHSDIQQIAEGVCREMGEDVTYVYEINQKLGTEGLEGWDKVENAPARMAVAASQALYGTTPTIDPTRGCGDCRRSYMDGMPMMSLYGNVVDQGGGKFEVRPGRQGPLRSDVRRKTSGHDVTESAEIERLWSGVKHALVFAVSYAGLAK